jgi:hypothetical protein
MLEELADRLRCLGHTVQTAADEIHVNAHGVALVVSERDDGALLVHDAEGHSIARVCESVGTTRSERFVDGAADARCVCVSLCHTLWHQSSWLRVFIMRCRLHLVQICTHATGHSVFLPRVGRANGARQMNGEQRLTIYGVTAEDWTARYGVEPCTHPCSECGTMLTTTIPFVQGALRGLAAQTCPCGNARTPFTLVRDPRYGDLFTGGEVRSSSHKAARQIAGRVLRWR